MAAAGSSSGTGLGNAGVGVFSALSALYGSSQPRECEQTDEGCEFDPFACWVVYAIGGLFHSFLVFVVYCGHVRRTGQHWSILKVLCTFIMAVCIGGGYPLIYAALLLFFILYCLYGFARGKLYLASPGTMYFGQRGNEIRRRDREAENEARRMRTLPAYQRWLRRGWLVMMRARYNDFLTRRGDGWLMRLRRFVHSPQKLAMMNTKKAAISDVELQELGSYDANFALAVRAAVKIEEEGLFRHIVLYI